MLWFAIEVTQFAVRRTTGPWGGTPKDATPRHLNVTLLGGLWEHAILSVTPEEIWAQAVSVAVR